MKLQLFSLTSIALLSLAATVPVRDNSVDCEKVQKAESNNYILQLTHETNIEEFVQELLHICNSKEEYDDSPQIYRSYNIGGKFKALKVHIVNDVLLNDLMSRFPRQIKTVIPDDVQSFFDMPVATDIKEGNDTAPCDWEKTGDSGTVSDISKRSSSSLPRRQNVFEFPSDTVFVAQPDQQETPWNLIRISERNFDPTLPYIYPEQAGAGVTVYVLDDGLNIDNVDFGGRATLGWSAFTNGSNNEGDQSVLKGGGHGTHVAGIIGGTHYGVAKQVNLVGVQVLLPNGQGSISDLLGGLEYVASQHRGMSSLSLINMSLGMSIKNVAASTFNDAVVATIDTGVAVIAAAGNSGDDGCLVTPASLSNVFTVSSTTKDDAFDTHTNHGPCVNILAPGVNITSDYIGSDYATSVMSGSSMAAPHATGVAALILPYLQHATVEELWAVLSGIATDGVISGIPGAGTPNALVFNGQRLTEN